MAANPHVVDGENIYVEERRMKNNAAAGGAGRGNYANRGRGGGQSQGRGGFPREGGRSAFNARGRGGAGGRGGRGGASGAPAAPPA